MPATMPVPEEPKSEDARTRFRHRWFPACVAILAIAWWLWRARYAQYHTILHVAVLFASVVSISSWYLLFGGGSVRLRRRIVAGIALAIVAFFVVFRPVYNGDMGVYRWRWRFAPTADQKLRQLTS